MKFHQVIENKKFVGREVEKKKFEAFADLSHAAILAVYGRRRVGKTELIEQVFRQRGLLKFEGLEGQESKSQIRQVLYQASNYFEKPFIADLKYDNWVPVLDLIADLAPSGKVTLYFEEIQWLANYESEFISALKFIWDNRLRHNSQCRIILCGSSPSFMINNIIHSKALYNRSQYEVQLQPFTLKETHAFLSNSSHHETLLAQLTVGGIPEYLRYLRDAHSVIIGICQNAFTKNSFFSGELKKIFVSSLGDNPHYQKIIRYLSFKKFSSRDEITAHLGIQSGGSISSVLQDLEQCGFIEQYKPYHLKSGRGLYRYCVSDVFLVFYYKFIEPIKQNITLGQYEENPTNAINMQSYHSWMGFAFERLVRRYQHKIAEILGFSGLPYRWGTFYNKETNEQSPGYQIDLLFEHSQHVFTICEIKYHSDKVDTSVIAEMEQKLSLFPNTKKHTIKKVLITTYGITNSVEKKAYFDQIITVDQLF